MIKKVYAHRSYGFLIVFIMVCALLLGSCSSLFQQADLSDQDADSQEGLADPVELDEIVIGTEDPNDDLEGIDISVTSQLLQCPNYTQYFIVEVAHILTMEGPGLLIREESGTPNVFNFMVQDGVVLPSDISDSQIPLILSGHVEHCQIHGGGMLSADISGSCVNDRLVLSIKEQRQEWDFSFDCDQQPYIPDVFPSSAPEIQHSFRIDTAGDTYVLEADAGLVSFYYSWTVMPDPDLGVIPLVEP